MIDTDTGEVYETPVFAVLAQFSRAIRPGGHAVWTRLERGGDVAEGDLHACATVNGDGVVAVQLLNTTGGRWLMRCRWVGGMRWSRFPPMRSRRCRLGGRGRGAVCAWFESYARSQVFQIGKRGQVHCACFFRPYKTLLQRVLRGWACQGAPV